MNKQKLLSINDYMEMRASLSLVGPELMLAGVMEKFGDRIALASSFGAEDVVIIDMLCKLTDLPRVFFLDTGRLHQQTYDLVEQVREHYSIPIEVYFPQTVALQKLVRSKGPNSFYSSIENRKECCYVRKVEPLIRALDSMSAWITGLRRSQSVTRVELDKVELDDMHDGIVKINPLAGWSEEQVWDYIHEHGVPYNKLHDVGFPSIGCAPCTRSVEPGEDSRSGRWWWESPIHKECGLHVRDGEVVR